MSNEQFYIDKNGIRYIATILIKFEIYGEYYCVYTIKDNAQNQNVYCAKLFGNNLLKIESDSEKRLTNKIVTQLINSLQNIKY